MATIKQHLILFAALFCLYSCTAKSTDDPIKAFTYWAGEPPQGVKVIHGKYQQSAHWTKEYILFLELEASIKWRKEFIEKNHLIEVTQTNGDPIDPPEWFKPNERFRALTTQGFNQGTVYYENPKTGHMFIYEIQL